MIRVALHFQSDRCGTVQEPLETVGVETEQNPASYDDFDAVICGSPGLLSDHLRFAGPVVYRLRGNLWEDRGGHLAKPRAWVKDRLFRGLCDGVLTPDERLDAMLRRRTNASRSSPVGLPITASEWPDVTHTNTAIQAVTLTNFNYEKKVAPLYPFTATVDGWLADRDGGWLVCGDGEYAADFADHAAGLDTITYAGYQPAKEALAEANVMIHPSNMDIQLPNAVLEGIASNLPVVTSDSAPFPPSDAYLSVSREQLPATLAALESPGERQSTADGQWSYANRRHSPGTIGHKIRSFIEGLL